MVRITPEMKSALSGVGNQQEFVRRAIDAALGSRAAGHDGPRLSVSLPPRHSMGAVQKPVAPKIPRKNSEVKSELSSNGRILLEAIRKRQIVSRREVKKDFGWDDPALLKASLELRGHVKMDTEKFWV